MMVVVVMNNGGDDGDCDGDDDDTMMKSNPCIYLKQNPAVRILNELFEAFISLTRTPLYQRSTSLLSLTRLY